MLQNLGEILIAIHKILWKEGDFLAEKRTDLALEAHALWRAAAKSEELEGVTLVTRQRGGCEVTEVRVESDAAARALGKARGSYVTLDLRGMAVLFDAADALASELRALLPVGAERVLVAGLGNPAMTPDALGSLCAEHILVTRHLRRVSPFSSLAEVSALTPNVLGRTGLEAAELVRAAVRQTDAQAVVAVDALCAQRLERVCTTVQLSDTGIVPGSGIGNHRAALTREALGVPVLAVGVPTVVDAATLARDVLEDAGAEGIDSEALRGQEGVTVTPRDIDAQVRALARLVGYGIDLALHPSLSLETLRALLE